MVVVSLRPDTDGWVEAATGSRQCGGRAGGLAGWWAAVEGEREWRVVEGGGGRRKGALLLQLCLSWVRLRGGGVDAWVRGCERAKKGGQD